MNGVREEIQHVLDSEIAKCGQLTPHQMCEVVKKYETYMAHKRLEGRGSSPSASQPKTTGHAANYKPCFHKTTAFAATVEEPEVDTDHQEPSLIGEADSQEVEPSQGDDEGLYIPTYLEEALPENPTLQVKMAHAMWAQERETRCCYKCNQPGHHLQRDHDKLEEKMGRGPSSQRCLPKTSWLKRGQY